MRVGRAVMVGAAGALAMSVLIGGARAIGMPANLELMLGTMVGLAPEGGAFAIGLGLHLAIGGLFGLLYAYVFERVIHHGGAVAGLALSVPHAIVAGVFMAIVPSIHPMIPEAMPAPGPFMANMGAIGVIAELVLHAVFGLIVGAAYGHIAEERRWAGRAAVRRAWPNFVASGAVGRK